MKTDTFKEITNRLYKAYVLDCKGDFNVKGEGYSFKVNISENKDIHLISVSNGEFNAIRKICMAIPYLYYCKRNNIL